MKTHIKRKYPYETVITSGVEVGIFKSLCGLKEPEFALVKSKATCKHCQGLYSVCYKIAPKHADTPKKVL